MDEELGVEEYAAAHGVSLTGVNSEGHSVLHLAAEELRLEQITASFFGAVTRAVPSEMVNWLTTSGRPSGSSALHMVAGSGRHRDDDKAEAIQHLVEARANVEQRDARGSTPFLRAAGVQSVRMLQTLAAVRADVHARHSGTQRTAMDMANAEAGLLT